MGGGVQSLLDFGRKSGIESLQDLTDIMAQQFLNCGLVETQASQSLWAYNRRQLLGG